MLNFDLHKNHSKAIYFPDHNPPSFRQQEKFQQTTRWHRISSRKLKRSPNIMEKKFSFSSIDDGISPGESNPTLDSLDKNICTKVLEKQKKWEISRKEILIFSWIFLKTPLKPHIIKGKILCHSYMISMHSYINEAMTTDSLLLGWLHFHYKLK